MTSFLKYLICIFIVAACSNPKGVITGQTIYNEPHRPQIHFTPKKAWMNDPNGMVFYNNQYHLFYQYYPDSTVWGPMHWGHATSKDLLHWQHLPVALYPDSLGYIFSGSAVADINNTSGFGRDSIVPLVAIFTHHDEKGQGAGKNTFQNQSLAYSLDEGTTWTKYAANPVLRNPGIKDFRDPKVAWHEESKKWIMTLATLDRITFYSSLNLKDWTKESEFGKEAGAHGGVWECPDLFTLDYKGQNIWVLLVSINPGAPNGGSGTQYFTGAFDGKTFTPYDTDTRWIDYGPDNYAGVTWSNTGNRKIFLGWMSNWQYAQLVPTKNWRSAMTIPRDLGIEKAGDKYFVVSKPSPGLSTGAGKGTSFDNVDVVDFDLTGKTGRLSGPARLTLKSDKIAGYSISLSNETGQQLVIGYDKGNNHYFIDRTASGNTSFEKGFAAKHTAPRLTAVENTDMTLIIDNASVEVFADGGLTVMTSVFFPGKPFSKIGIRSADGFKIKQAEYRLLKPATPTNAVAK